ncbi:MAG: hypothetical protein HC824_13825 [Synechococcales cyanobacterium RM1_1_8]|nr:hypothetical protein [Synechococcales cyanobacterium RM1_1_8]
MRRSLTLPQLEQPRLMLAWPGPGLADPITGAGLEFALGAAHLWAAGGAESKTCGNSDAGSMTWIAAMSSSSTAACLP